MNRHAVAIYSMNHPTDPSIGKTVREIHHYGHQLLHITHIHRQQQQQKFLHVVNEIRYLSGMPMI